MNRPVAIRDKVIIRPIDQSARFDTADPKILIFKPEAAKRNIDNGIIISKGPLVSDDLDIGDHVMFNGHSGDKLAIDGSGVFFSIQEEFILTKLTQSTVKIIDTETVKQIITGRIAELRMKFPLLERVTLPKLEESLLERIDTITSEERHY